MERVCVLEHFQIALHLLRCIDNSRFTQSFRLSSGQASQDLAKEMMKATRETLSKMLQCKELPEASWLQALLPKGPGLGFTNLELMAPNMAHASIPEATRRLIDLDNGPFTELRSDTG